MLDDFLRKVFLMSRALRLAPWRRGEIAIDTDTELLDAYSDKFSRFRAKRLAVAPFFSARSAAVVDKVIDNMMRGQHEND